MKLFKLSNFIIFIGLFSILPFLIIALFNHPSGDDFTFHSMSEKFGYLNAQSFWYFNWTGRYISTMILSLPFLTQYPFYLYKIVPLILIILTLHSFYYLLSAISSEIKFYSKVLISLVLMTTYLYSLPSVSEGYYWLSGSITYQLPNVLSFYLLGFLIYIMRDGSKKHFYYSALTIIGIVGSNETSMIIVIIILISIFMYRFRFNIQILKLLLTSLFFSGILILAPGNEVRAAAHPNSKIFISSFIHSLMDLSHYILKWLPFAILINIILIGGRNQISTLSFFKSDIFKVHSKYLFVCWFLILISSFLPAHWSLGISPPARTVNVGSLFFILGLFYFTFVYIYKSRKKNNPVFQIGKIPMFFVFLILIVKFSDANNIKTVYGDLFRGKANNYSRAMENRYNILLECEKDTCAVPRLRDKPKTIFVNDILEVPDEKGIQQYSNYFLKESIILE